MARWMARWVVAVVALVGAGCSRGGVPADVAVAPLVAPSDDAVVATVDGRPIYARAVADQARARGVDVRRALQDLVDAEVLAGEAARRGLASDLQVRDETKGALVRAYLGATFERDVTSADVPAISVRRAYIANKWRFDHSIMADVWHLLVQVPKGASAEERQKARARAEALARRARGIGSLDAFKQLASDEKLYNERFATAKDGIAEKSFSEPLFAEVRQPGDTSGVLETSYGYHVAYLIRWIPATHVTVQEAEPTLRSGLFPELQKKAFGHLLDEAMSRYHIEQHPERLPKSSE